MAAIIYDRSALMDAQRSLNRLKAGEHLPVLAQLISAGGVKLTMDTFRNQRDPYGRPWKPLARERTRDRNARLRAERAGKKSRGHKILIDTARMRNSTTAIRMGKSGGVAIPTGYAASHQNGATIRRMLKDAPQRSQRQPTMRAANARHSSSVSIAIPQRMMLPDAQMGLPGTWTRMIQRETTGLLKRWVERGARR